ncbi:uncharacterized protein LOC132740705 isoform X2 [Ruditapes philippinarum]|uniref:uncharacterized protein LOC132740705 isoform X2 n=1 Tax=Ruditapes philippinarum TaxID=129788 RepID=UPI00295BA158|nr:uncharacterized protein LOC132740705 isoform X2 [Ruditapes philippinarum]
MESNNHYWDSDTAKDSFTAIASGGNRTEQGRIYDTVRHGTGELADKTTPSAKMCTWCTLVNSILIGLLIIAVSVSLYMSINVSKASNNKADLQKLVTTLSQKINVLEHAQVQIQTEVLQNLTNIFNETNVSIGFAVSNPDNSSDRTVLKFRKVIYNSGDDYNVSSGVFTCNHPGLYFFTATLIRSPSLLDSVCFISVNGIEQIEVSSGGTDVNSGYQSGSGSFIYRLKEGDIVVPSDCEQIDQLGLFSSFTGFRVSY